MLDPFQLPNELILSSIISQYPCRETQIHALATLLSSRSPSPRNIVLYGTEATGKSAVTQAVLSALSSSTEPLGNGETDQRETLRYAIIRSAECITGRHLLETTIGAISEAVDWKGSISRCENLAQLAVEAGILLGDRKDRTEMDGEYVQPMRFVLVFDGIDKQRDAPPTLLPALARLGEVIPNLTTVFIVTAPRPHFLHTPGTPYIHFPAYAKAEAIQILGLNPPSIYQSRPPRSLQSPLSDSEELARSHKESKEVWTRVCSAVWDTLSKHSGRDIISLRSVCDRLWHPFTSPIRDGNYAPREFPRLLVTKRTLLQDESILIPNIVSSTSTVQGSTDAKRPKQDIGIASQLPHTSRFLLVAAYLASYTPARHDILLFGKSSSGKKRKGGATSTPRAKPGVSRSRKINRKLLGPQAFVLERMLAIFHAIRLHAGVGGDKGGSAVTGSADVLMAVATLASLRLVVKTSAVADALDASTKWKVNVGWDVVRGLARSVGVEIDDFLID